MTQTLTSLTGFWCSVARSPLQVSIAIDHGVPGSHLIWNIENTGDRPITLTRLVVHGRNGSTETVALGLSHVLAPQDHLVLPTDVDPDSNRGLGYRLMLQFGFAADQWQYLDALWQRESGWNHLAENTSSGAYGIPQSLPGSKMADVAPDWRTNPETQITWGLAYIAARYDNPQGAWGHSQRVGWY